MIRVEQLTFNYPQQAEPVFRDLNLTLRQGETLLVCGSSGSGKSTFLRTLNGLAPHFSGGSIRGRIIVNGLEVIKAGPAVMSRQVGFVFQDPESQFVMQIVEDELAFGLENAAVPVTEMSRRIDGILTLTGILQLKKRRLETLSGGEKQKVAIAAALVLQPTVLVMDEPTSQLDAQSAEELLNSLMELKKALGLTLVIAEHRLERLLPLCDKLLYLDGKADGWKFGDVRQIISQIPLAPPLVELAKHVGYQPMPLTVEEGKAMARAISPLPKIPLPNQNTLNRDADLLPPHEPVFLRVENLWVSYSGKPALRGINLTIGKGERVAMMGRNGAGKTSLLRAIMGLVQPESGKVIFCGDEIQKKTVWERSQRIGYLPQDPNSLLFAETVLDELQITLANFSRQSSQHQLLELLDQLGLSEYVNAYPRDLSVGERQRVALASILVMQPQVLLLDEPTRGLDVISKRKLIELFSAISQRGTTLLVVTHDVEFIAQFAQRVIWLDEGGIIEDGDPRHVLSLHPNFTPQMLHLFPEDMFLTVEEVLEELNLSDIPAP